MAEPLEPLEVLAPAVQELLRQVARPGGMSREQLQADAAALLVRFGVTCEPERHIGPLYQVPGTIHTLRCMTCRQTVIGGPGRSGT